MKRAALVAVSVLASLASGAGTPPRAEAACAFFVVWHDRPYTAIGTPESTLPTPGTPVHGAVEPGCNDTTGANGHPTAVTARRVERLSPDTALFVRGTVLVAYGYFPQLADVFTGATVPTDQTRNCRLGGPVHITGRAGVAFGFLSVFVEHSTVRLHHLRNGEAQASVDGHTRIDGLVRHGLPYIGVGQRVRVSARFCKVPDSIGTKIVARRIVPAGPIVPPSTAEDVLGVNWRAQAGIAARASGGRSWPAYGAIAAAALVIAGLLLARRRSRRPGTG